MSGRRAFILFNTKSCTNYKLKKNKNENKNKKQ